MAQACGLHVGRIYRLPSGCEIAAFPAMDETMRFEREPGALDLYTRNQWAEASFADMTVLPDGRVDALCTDGDAIVGYDDRLGLKIDDLQRTGDVVGCEFCEGLPWPGEFSIGGHGEHDASCPLVKL